jgi:N-acylneuraminate cytidylyltransferase
MIGQRRVLAIVAGRGGSKGLPGKNVAMCGGRPLVAWSVEAARSARSVDRVIVTSDDQAIIAAAREAGADAPFVRPAALASDEASMADVVLHALDSCGEGFEVGVLLQATSPLRLGEDIDGALEALERTKARSVTSVTESPKSPLWMFTLDPEGRLRSLLPGADPQRRRQELAKTFTLNGAIYGFEIPWFRSGRRFIDEGTLAHVMPAERSVDVDAAVDLALAEVLLSRRVR